MLLFLYGTDVYTISLTNVSSNEYLSGFLVRLIKRTRKIVSLRELTISFLVEIHVRNYVPFILLSSV